MRLFRLILASVLVCLLSGCGRTNEVKRNEKYTEAKSTQRLNEPTPAKATKNNRMSPAIRFTEVPNRAGIDFQHISGDCDQKPFPAANGSGVAAIDYDLDGWYDLYFLSGTSFPVSNESSEANNRCYRNRSDFLFYDVTEATGLAALAYCAGVVSGDFNNDGFPDLYINCFGPNRLFVNQGDGSFREMSRSASIDDPSWGTSAAAFDFDNDGDLDIYVCNYAEWTWEANQFCGNRERNIRIFCSPRSVKPVPDRLFENLGDGSFRDVLGEVGLGRDPARGQGVIAADLDNDSYVDLYVGNDINTNSFFRNKGDGTFEDLTDVTGTAVDFAGQTQAGMGVDVADIDRDGLVEIFVTNYEGEHNAFYRNLGNNVFQETSQSTGMAAPSMKWVGWGTSFADFDLDGWVDLVITNGHTDNNLQELGRDAIYEQPPLLFRNHEGKLLPVQAPEGTYFAGSHPGRALCVVDLDEDRIPDIVIGHKDKPPAILRNTSDVAHNLSTLVLNFIGVLSNRDGIGTSVEVVGSPRIVHNQIKSGGSYLSSQPYRLSLAVSQDALRPLRIQWPNGQVELLEITNMDGEYSVVQGSRTFVKHVR